jgi:hypothetical protein
MSRPIGNRALEVGDGSPVARGLIHRSFENWADRVETLRKALQREIRSRQRVAEMLQGFSKFLLRPRFQLDNRRDYPAVVAGGK